MLKLYQKGDHPSGYHGVRVAVSVNNKVKQKYFSIAKYGQDKAIELATVKEREWLKLQKQAYNNRVFSKWTNTGLLGLQLTWDKLTWDKRYPKYTYPVLTYQYYYKKKFICKHWYLHKRDIKDLWFEVCLFIKNTRNARYRTFEKMLLLCPTADQVQAIY